MASPTPHVLTSASSTEESGEEARREGGGREKEELIGKILELQNTLHDLTQRVNSVKEENSKLKSENEVLNQYIENLMATSGSFKSSDGKK
ncbi:Short coiled-coil protein B [Geodia barretti]|uniref:Short coiled-coil protein B n=1 Tax=Geodia barretti TaxID=519541 RepID=A0AA35XAG7_GEOBA|nr:Short coiled-coil protein B [Geodia barretti]